MFEEVDIGDDVEHSAFMHPLTEGDHFSASIHILLLLAFVQIHMYNSMDRNGIVVIQSELFLVLPLVQHFHVIRTEVVAIGVQSAIDELDGSSVAVLGEETDSLFSCLDLAQHFMHSTVHEQCILDFVPLFLVLVSIE